MPSVVNNIFVLFCFVFPKMMSSRTVMFNQGSSNWAAHIVNSLYEASKLSDIKSKFYLLIF